MLILVYIVYAIFALCMHACFGARPDAHCPPTDAFQILKRIHKLETRLLRELAVTGQTLGQQQQGKTYPDCPFCERHCALGVKGFKGNQGDKGLPGLLGFIGPKGSRGDRGNPCIPPPPTYVQPKKGYRGEPGPKGSIGLKGARSACECLETDGPCPRCGQKRTTAPRGDPGDWGLDGLPGRKGRKGERGDAVLCLQPGKVSLPGRPGIP